MAAVTARAVAGLGSSSSWRSLLEPGGVQVAWKRGDLDANGRR
jgi:hypothetical protein